MKTSAFRSLISIVSISIVAAQDCVFEHIDEGVKQIYRNEDKFIRVVLEKTPSPCFVHVETPSGQNVTFNISQEDDSKVYGGDKFEGEIYLASEPFGKLDFTNTSEAFGDRLGKYIINGEEVFALPDPPTLQSEINQVVIPNKCVKNEDNTWNLKGSVNISMEFSKCLDYNRHKGRSQDDYLRSRATIFINKNQSTMEFHLRNSSLPEFKIHCIVEYKNYDDLKKITYPMEIEVSCPEKATPAISEGTNLWWLWLMALLVVILASVSIVVYIKKTAAIDNNPLQYRKLPPWAEGLFHQRGLLNISDIDIEHPLGRGAFGIVYKATLQYFGIDMAPAIISVAVKTYPPESLEGHDDLHKEGELLANLEYHPSVINLLGVSMDTIEFNSRILLLVDLCAGGCLLTTLKRKREEIIIQGKGWTEEFNLEMMTSWCFQISKGMEFLSKSKIIHGDLAARNLLLDGHNNIKISDFGKAFKIQQLDDKEKVIGKMPLAWMSPEAILNEEISLQSDIWAFGIALWEIFSLGLYPYADQESFHDVVVELTQGYRLPAPENCPGKIYNLMMDCWKEQPEERLGWQDITSKLKGFVDTKYLDKYWNTEKRQRRDYNNIRNYSAKQQ